MKPLCFVIMPFNKKKDADGKIIDFDVVYQSFIHKAIEDAGMEPIRADEETVNGIIHKPMYERLLLCDYAVADLTTANANVFYELGIRHAVKPFTTITVFVEGSDLPFDLKGVRCLPYRYDKEEARLTKADDDIAALTKLLKQAKKDKNTDSPIYQLVDGISFQNSVAHQKTDIFRDQVKYNKDLKEELYDIRNTEKKNAQKVALLNEFVKSKIDADDEEAGVLIDIMLSYRSMNAFEEMIAFIDVLPPHVKNTVMVQEQLGFALNRVGEKDKAIIALESVLKQNGPSSETYGILGRVYKDKYDQAIAEEDEMQAEAFLDKAIETYQKGFEADWRDAYPGINVLTLLEIKGEREKINALLPVVLYAVRRKLKIKTPDYWDYATLFEISVINNDDKRARENLQKALTIPIEGSWMLKTTMDTLERIIKVRKSREEAADIAEKYLALLKKELAKREK